MTVAAKKRKKTAGEILGNMTKNLMQAEKSKPPVKKIKKKTTKPSANSNSSIGEQNSKIGSLKTTSKRKRVSFSSASPKVSILDADNDATEESKSSTDSVRKSPRSILKRKSDAVAATTSTSAAPTAPKIKKNFAEKKSNAPEKLQQSESETKDIENKTNVKNVVRKRASDSHSPANTAAKFRKVHRKVKMPVSRSVKEKLATMNRQDRKRYLRELRQKRRPLHEVVMKSKKLWEVVRNFSSKTKTKERDEKIDELCSLCRGKVKQLIYGHDTVRVIQHLVTLNKPEIQSWLFDELRDDIIRMCKSKYAKFFVEKMLKHGSPEQRAQVLSSFSGQVNDMLKHPFACDVLERAYNEHANARQRWTIMTELYGKQIALEQTKITEAGATKPAELTLKHLLEKEPAKRDLVLGNIRSLLMALTLKPTLRHSICHKLLIDYLTLANPEQQKEMAVTLIERVPEILHTRDGAWASCYCIWLSSAKERKTLIKSLKTLVAKTCQEEHGCFVLMAIFDSVDDTVLVKRFIIQEMIASLDSIMGNKNGLRVLAYLLKPRDGRYLQKEQVEFLAKGDTNPESKKDQSVRWSELRTPLVIPVLRYIAKHARQIALGNDEDKRMALLVLSALEVENLEAAKRLKNQNDEDLNTHRMDCFKALAELCTDEFVPANFESGLHPVEHPRAHFIISRLLRADKHLVAVGLHSFTAVLVQRLAADELCAWTACNRGCFVLLYMLESKDPEAVVVRNALQPYKEKLEKSSNAGAQQLLKNLSEN